MFTVIEGYIKQPFIVSSADRMTCIIGALTDGENKINLRVRDVEKSEKLTKLEKGQKIKVSGFLDVDGKDEISQPYLPML